MICKYCKKKLNTSIMTPFGNLKKTRKDYHFKCLKENCKKLEQQFKKQEGIE